MKTVRLTTRRRSCASRPPSAPSSTVRTCRSFPACSRSSVTATWASRRARRRVRARTRGRPYGGTRDRDCAGRVDARPCVLGSGRARSEPARRGRRGPLAAARRQGAAARRVVRSTQLQIAVVGVGRIGALHADLVARQVAGATLAAVTDTDGERAERVAARLRVPARSYGRDPRRPRRRRGRDLLEHRHPRRPDRRGRRAREGDLLREADLARSRTGGPRAGRCRACGVLVPGRIQPALRPRAPLGARRRRRRRGRRRARRADHEPRSGAAAARLRRASPAASSST